ncbi:MAG: hypothetical protein JW837_14450 [Sedimentisphaerales bacterium]|nr:hypothetical protein [Sedimentisphaerales bacterium]
MRFNCENCGYKSTVSDDYAGKNIRCPNCNYIIFIEKTESSETTQTGNKHSAYDASLLNIQEQNILKHRQRQEYIAAELAYESEEEEEEISYETTDPAALRKAPWLIDIFLFPFNKPGLKHLALFIVIPPLITIIEDSLPSPLNFMLSFFNYIIKFFIFLYIYWYLAECVRESAAGWVRAPYGFGGLPIIKDMFNQVISIIGCLAVFLGPFAIYTISVGQMNMKSWFLLGLAVFLYPMGLLSVLMHDSSEFLRIRTFTKSIPKAFFPYLGFIILLLIQVMLIRMIPEQKKDSIILNILFRFIIIYTALIDAHLLGRLYWRYQDRFNWDV